MEFNTAKQNGFVACSSWNQRSKGIFCDTKSPQGGPVMEVAGLGPMDSPRQRIELQKSFDKNFNYIPGSQMTSIFEGQPPKTRPFSNQNKGPHLGSRYIYIYT